MMEKTSLIKTFSAVEMFLYTHPELSLTTVYRPLLGLGACVCLYHSWASVT